ncbi:MAG: hypothetical protein ACPIOQ_35625 [Promethearchaeia archaeon]
MERGLTRLQFGSPFHLNAFGVQAAETVQDAPPGLPVVLWDVPNGLSGGSRSGRPDELVPATTAVTSAAPAAGGHSPLGCVTFCIRGRTSGEMQPDAEDAEHRRGAPAAVRDRGSRAFPSGRRGSLLTRAAIVC